MAEIFNKMKIQTLLIIFRSLIFSSILDLPQIRNSMTISTNVTSKKSYFAPPSS